MIIKHKLKIDLLRKEIYSPVSVVQGDYYTREVSIALYCGGAPWKLPDGHDIVIRYSKSDGTTGIYDKMPDGSKAWVVKDNAVDVLLCPQMLACPGKANVQVSIIVGALVLSTFTFIVDVTEDPSKGAAQPEPYINWSKAFMPQTTGAKVGQYVQISKVDASGRIIEVIPVDAPSGSGIGAEAANLLITILRAVAAYSPDQATNITALQAALAAGGGNSGGSGEGGEGGDDHSHSYTAVVTTPATCTSPGVRTYTCECGHSYTEAIPTTAHNYADGTCTNCGAADPNHSETETTEPVYQLARVTTFDGQTTVDTGYNLFDRDKDWTICVTARIDNGPGYAFSAKADTEAARYPAIAFRRSWQKYVPFCYGYAEENSGFAYNAEDIKVVFTRSAGAGQKEFATMYFVKDGAVEEFVCGSNNDFIPIADSSIMLGGCIKADGTVIDYMEGEISDFRVYERVLTADEIGNYLEVSE